MPEDILERALALPRVDRVAGMPGVHLVGGAVRDLLMGRTPLDLDFVVEGGDATAVAERLGGPVVVHDRFGTASVPVDGHTYDVARARAETYPHPGALPEVRPATLEEDLSRRDFTVNTFALALGPPEAGRLASFPGAHEDLEARRLRVLHPGSFRDDPTRLLRLARYAARLHFAPDADTLTLARTAVADGALGTVSGPRIGAELALAAREPDPLAAFAALRALRVDRAIEPGFGIDDPAVAAVALSLLPADGRRDLLVLALACRGVEDPAGLLTRLAFRREDVRRVADALDQPDLAGASPSAIAVALRTPEQAALAGALGAEREARRWLEDLRHVRLRISGRDLVDAGVPPGAAIGAALRDTLARRLDGEVPDDHAAQLRAALDAARRMAAG